MYSAGRSSSNPCPFLGGCALLIACLLLAFALAPQAEGQGKPGSRPGGDWVLLLEEGFEGEFPGSRWSLDGDPAWSRESFRPRTGSWSGYCAGGGSKGVDPPGPYPNDTESWMIFGPFDLSNASGAELAFSYWTGLADGTDHLFWGVSSSGWLFLGRKVGGDSGGWQQVTYDIAQEHPAYLEKSKVWIGFKFESDAAGQSEGAYLDDITLRVQRGPGASFRALIPLLARQHPGPPAAN